jgi:hypothetical protein
MFVSDGRLGGKGQLRGAFETKTVRRFDSSRVRWFRGAGSGRQQAGGRWQNATNDCEERSAVREQNCSIVRGFESSRVQGEGSTDVLGTQRAAGRLQRADRRLGNWATGQLGDQFGGQAFVVSLFDGTTLSGGLLSPAFSHARGELSGPDTSGRPP